MSNKYLVFHNNHQIEAKDINDKVYRWLIPEGSFVYARTTNSWSVKRAAGFEAVNEEQVPEKTRLLFLIVNQ